MNRKITAFHKDEIGDWRADLECGHRQHVRHDPPLISRPWVLTGEGRASRIGLELNCKHCDEATDREDSDLLGPTRLT
jgi:hypothetical protein